MAGEFADDFYKRLNSGLFITFTERNAAFRTNFNLPVNIASFIRLRALYKISGFDAVTSRVEQAAFRRNKPRILAIKAGNNVSALRKFRMPFGLWYEVEHAAHNGVKYLCCGICLEISDVTCVCKTVPYAADKVRRVADEPSVRVCVRRAGFSCDFCLSAERNAGSRAARRDDSLHHLRHYLCAFRADCFSAASVI